MIKDIIFGFKSLLAIPFSRKKGGFKKKEHFGSILNRYNRNGTSKSTSLTSIYLAYNPSIKYNGLNKRDKKWTESIAVGDIDFVLKTKSRLGAKGIGRKVIENNEGFELREDQESYNPVFAPENIAVITPPAKREASGDPPKGGYGKAP